MEGKYGEPWVLKDALTCWCIYNAEGNIVIELTYGTCDIAKKAAKKYGKRICACVNAFEGKEPGDWVAVEKNKFDLYQNSIECELIGLRQRVRCNVINNNAALKERLDEVEKLAEVRLFAMGDTISRLQEEQLETERLEKKLVKAEAKLAQRDALLEKAREGLERIAHKTEHTITPYTQGYVIAKQTLTALDNNEQVKDKGDEKDVRGKTEHVALLDEDAGFGKDRFERIHLDQEKQLAEARGKLADVKMHGWPVLEILCTLCKRVNPHHADCHSCNDTDFFRGILTALEVQGKPLPHIVCLCGSTEFKDEYVNQNYRLTLEGNIVLSIGCDAKSDDELGITGEQKVELDRLHKCKIDLADSILVLNVGGYIGKSTASEIIHTMDQGKAIAWLEPDLMLTREQCITIVEGSK